MKLEKRTILLLFICFGLQILCLGQDMTVRGQVIDARDGSPLIGAHIIPMSDWSNGATAGVDGGFELVTDAEDSLLISFVGYEERLMPVRKDADMIIQLDMTAAAIEAVEVVAERLISEEFSVKKIRRLDVYKNPNAKGDALLAVNGLPSVTTTDESANISFRGSGPGETGIFFNQVPVYDAVRFSQLNGIGTFSIFNTEMVSAVNVFPGNPPLEYGNTTSGLISISSRDEVQRRLSQVNVSMAGLGFFRGDRLGKNKRTSLIAFGNYQPSYLLSAVNPESLSDIPWFRSIDGGIHVSGAIGEKTQLKIFNYTLAEGYDFNFESPSFLGVFNQRKMRNLTIANLSRRIKNGVFSVNSGYHRSRTDLGYSQFDYKIANEDIYLSTNVHKEKHRFEWKYGLAADYRRQLFDAVIPQYGFALGRSHPALEVSSDEDRLIVDGFGFFKYRPSNKLSYGYSARVNAPTSMPEVKLGRQSSVSYNPTDQHRLIFSRGTYHKYDWIGDQGLSWISSRQVAIDYQYDRKLWKATVAVYQKDVEMDAANDDIKGVETYFMLRPSSKFYWDISYSFIDISRSMYDRVFPGQADLNYFVRSGLEWNFSMLWTIGGRMLWRQGTHVAGLERASFRDDLSVFEPTFGLIDQQAARLPHYQVIDLNLSRLFSLTETINGVLFLSVSNLTNRSNVRGYTYNTDYTERSSQLLSRRTLFAGTVLYFQ